VVTQAIMGLLEGTGVGDGVMRTTQVNLHQQQLKHLQMRKRHFQKLKRHLGMIHYVRHH
jgi:hypothetical protein